MPRSVNDVFRNMALLALGAGGAKLIGLAVMPVLTRIYSPEDFGVLSVFTSSVMMLAPLVGWRYVMAIPLPASDRFAINVFALSFFLVFIFSVALAFALWLLSGELFVFLSLEPLQPYWYLITAGVFFASSYELVTMWATREKLFKPLARIQILQMALGSGLKFTLGLLGLHPAGLLIGQITQQGAGSVFLIRSLKGRLRGGFKEIKIRRMFFMARYYKAYPLLKMPSHFLFVFASQSPVVIASVMFGEAKAGQLGVAIMSLSLPLSLISQTAGKAYYAEVAKIGRKNAKLVLSLTKSVAIRLFCIGGIISSAIFFFAPTIFPLVFGENWSVAGKLASFLSVYLMFQFVAAPIITVLNVYNRQGLAFFIHLFRASLVVLVFCFSSLFEFPLETSILAYSLFLSLSYFLVIVIIFRLLVKESVSQQSINFPMAQN